MDEAIVTLKGKAKVRKTMWSRRAQEYESKINSGSLVSIAEVVRDLYRKDDQGEQSYSERQMYQAALERLASEFAAVDDTDKSTAVVKLEKIIDDTAVEAA
jgi:CarD family transcriptional regulator